MIRRILVIYVKTAAVRSIFGRQLSAFLSGKYQDLVEQQ